MKKLTESSIQPISSKINKTMSYLLITLFGVYTLGSINSEAINKDNEDGYVSTDTRNCKGGASFLIRPLLAEQIGGREKQNVVT